MGELDHRPSLLKPARPPESMENPPRLASSNCSVGGCALCWNYNLRACTECVPVTDVSVLSKNDHIGGAHVTSHPAKSGECRELGRPTAMTHYGWMPNLGRWSYDPWSGPGCLYSQVFSLLWNAEGARSIHIIPSAADASVGGSPRYHHSSLTSLTMQL